jgi:hypothetical protein
MTFVPFVLALGTSVAVLANRRNPMPVHVRSQRRR